MFSSDMNAAVQFEIFIRLDTVNRVDLSADDKVTGIELFNRDEASRTSTGVPSSKQPPPPRPKTGPAANVNHKARQLTKVFNATRQ